ncbi:MAG: M48 family metalloprotease [Armatimonadetes bacterium]|nr:M48 family metalloprotease [Armatimonadota bacterium]
MRVMRHTIVAVLVACLLVTATSESALAKKWDPKKERELGQQVTAEVEKHYKRYEDPEALKRIQDIVAAIVPHTQRPDVQYDIRLLDTKEVNAFSIPGGFIYVTKGLLEAVQSDHELAGVIAHEIAHNSHYHALVQAERSRKLFMGALGAALAAIILGAGSDVVATTAQAGLYVRQGVLSRYSIDMEREADRDATRYLLASNYNPVGILTFMERLARDERRTMPPDAGVFQDHPLGYERVAMLINELTAAGVVINRRATINWRKPEVKEVEVPGREEKAPAVVWWDRTIFVFIGPDAEAERARAADFNERLTEALARGAGRAHFAIDQIEDGVALLAYGEPLLVVKAEDAAAHGKEPALLARETLEAIYAALAQERFAYEL